MFETAQTFVPQPQELFVRMMMGPRFERVALLGLAGIIIGGSAACDHQPLTPPGPLAPTAEQPSGAPQEASLLTKVVCTGSTVPISVACVPVAPSTSGALGDIIIGGQNQYVRLVSANVNYDGSQYFTFDVTLRNLIPQSLGTSDGTTLDPSGIKVFFNDGPTVTSGSGAIAVIGDGVGTFTGSSQPFYQYNLVLQQDAASPARTWTLQMPPTVTTFAFTAYVSAPVQYPGGYIRLTAGSTTIRADGVRAITGRSVTAVGNEVTGTTITWSSSDTTRALVDGAGFVSGVRDGAVTVTATDGVRTSSLGLTITPITRYWTAAGGTTNLNLAANWSRNVAPTPNDSLRISVNGLNVYPQLTSNVATAGLFLEDNASFGLGAFDLSVANSVVVGNGANLSATSGRLDLTGISKTLAAGTTAIPQIRVSGRYSASTDVAVSRRIQVNGGRLTVSGVRVTVNTQ